MADLAPPTGLAAGNEGPHRSMIAGTTHTDFAALKTTAAGSAAALIAGVPLTPSPFSVHHRARGC